MLQRNSATSVNQMLTNLFAKQVVSKDPADRLVVSASADDKTFKQHTTFYYRSCSLIKVDVDFEETDAREAQPSDKISKVSMPYLDARPRR